MPTNANQVKQYLDFALLQLGAESYLHGLDFGIKDRVVERWKYGFNDSSHPYIQGKAANGADTPVLPAYNRMVESQAGALFDSYEIIDHHANDATGFSATLFKNKQTGEYILSPRSTEFRQWSVAGDGARDNLGANKGGIVDEGFALAQLASLEDYYAQLKAPGGKLEGVAQISLTGYSLSGHLATVFTLMHESEVHRTHVFNAAGHGLLVDGSGAEIAGRTTGAALRSMLTLFSEVVRNPLDVVVDAGNATLANLATLARQAYANDPTWNPFVSEEGRINSDSTPRGNIYQHIRYLFASAYVQQQYPTRSLTVDFAEAFATGFVARLAFTGALFEQGLAILGGQIENGAGSQSRDGSGYGKITQLFGAGTHDDYQGVSNSQLHTANLVPIVIEDQQDVYGIPDFLGQGHGLGDFATSHALILQIDTLSLVYNLQQLISAATLESITPLIAAASNQRASSNYALNPFLLTKSAKSEGDSLEKLLDGLRSALYTEAEIANTFSSSNPFITPFNNLKDGFGDFDNRTLYYEHLADLLTQGKTKKSGLSLKALVEEKSDASPQFSDIDVGRYRVLSATQIEDLAKADTAEGMAVRYALEHGNAFALAGGDLYGDYQEGGPLAGQLDRYQQASGAGAITEAWIAARSQLLERRLLVNLHNLNNDVDKPVNVHKPANPTEHDATRLLAQENVVFEDRELAYRLDLGAKGGHRRVVFGKDDADAIEGGAADDHLFGETGDDNLLANAGKDYLEGGAGNDVLSGGTEDDILFGGKGNDVMRGGSGVDTYVIGRNSGTDRVIDFEGRVGGLLQKAERGDGKGKIEWAGQDLSGAKTLVDTNDPKLFQDGNGFRYHFTGVKDSRGTLKIYRVDGDSSVVNVDSFKSGDLGITLQFGEPVDKANVNGDNESNVLGLIGAAFTKYFGRGGGDLIYVHLAEAEGWGGPGPDGLYNGEGNQYLYGEEGDDILVASGGNDELFGGTDNDALQGGLDSDFLSGDEGSDFLAGGAGADVLVGGDGRDFLFGGNNLVAIGFGGSPGGSIIDAAGQGWFVSHTVDAISGATTYDFSGFTAQDQGGALDEGDTIDAGLGDDFVLAGQGDDLVLGDEGADLLAGEGGSDTLFGGAGDDEVSGDGLSDTQGALFYLAPEWHAGDLLDGEAGNDILFGQGGGDTLYGGEGDDELQGDSRTLAQEYHGDDYLDGEAGNDKLFGNGGEDTLFGGDGNDELSGDGSTLAGQAHGADYLDGEKGDDILQGDGGADTIFGGEGNDLLAGDSAALESAFHGDDTLDGDSGDDVLQGQGGNDQLAGGSGADQLEGGDGDDELEGNAGNDVLVGGMGTDRYTFSVGDGSDSLYEESSGNVIRFGEGIALSALSAIKVAAHPSFVFLSYGTTDTVAIENALLGSVTRFELADASAVDLRTLLNASLASAVSVAGTAGADQAYGGAGGDRLHTLAGDDVLTGGRGADYLQGGTGNDTYFYAAGDGSDVILDEAGIDRILFDSSVTLDDLKLQKDTRSLRLQFKNSPDGITIANALLDASLEIETVEFGDGTTLTFDEMLALAVTVPDLGGLLLGTPGNDTLTGGAGDDIISSLEGNDRLDGAGGDDFIDGGTGDDTYIASTGKDVIDDADDAAGNTDRLIMRAGVSPLTVSVGVDATDGRLILIDGTNNRVKLPNTVLESDVTHLVERVEFADGTVWTPSDLLDRASLDFFGGFADEANPGSDVNDFLVGSFGNDTLSGGKRHDIIYGGGGDDTLDGGAGNDYLVGGGGRDTLLGGDGIDQMLGGAGTNTFDGGRGNDLLHGSQLDHDTYRFNLGDGQDVLHDRATPYAPNRIVFGAGITPDTLRFVGASLRVGDAGDRIDLVGGLVGGNPGSVVGEVEFADGTVLSYAELVARTVPVLPPFGTPTEGNDYLRGGIGADTIEGQGGNDSIVGQAGDDTLAGGAGDDALLGGDGDDRLDGGTGNDTLLGERGGDTYLFGFGAGQDVLYDNDTNLANVDTVRFGPGISPDDLDIRRDFRNVYVTLNGSTDRLTILEWGAGRASRIERFEFADGTLWSGSQLIDRSVFGIPNLIVIGTDGDDVISGSDGADDLRGGPGNDVLDGGAGSDRLDGGVGDDAFVFGRGYSHDIAIDDDQTPGNTDVVLLAGGITPADVVLTQDNTNVYLSLDGGDRLTLSNWMLGEQHRIEQIRFALGTVWDSAEILARATLVLPPGTGTDGDDVLFGTDEDDAMNAYAGQDVMYGNSGNDVIDGGNGDDWIYGEADNDALAGSDGIDSLFGGEGDDELEGGSEADYLEGGTGADVLTGGAGADLLRGGPGGDTYRFGLGDGADNVLDIDATPDVVDRVVVGSGVSPGQVTLARSLENLVLTIDGTDDQLTIEGWFIGADWRVERVEFADGTVWTADALTALFPPPAPSDGNDLLRGTEEADVIDALAGHDNVYGLGGDDTLAGNTGNDRLIGGAGDDVLVGGMDYDSLLGDAGADTLDGGFGSDYLVGGSGSDLYLVRRGEGSDSLSQYGALLSDADTVRFLDAASMELTIERSYHDLWFWLDGQTFTLLGIYDFAVTGNLRFEFQDAVTWTLAEATGRATFIEPPGGSFVGTSGDETFVGSEGADTIELFEGDDYAYAGLGADLVLGGPGSDHLYGEGGDDTLDGGEYGPESEFVGYARDVLEGGAGNDTYVMRPSSDVDTVYEYDTTEGNTDTLRITGGVLPGETFLRRDGNDLAVYLHDAFFPTGTMILSNWWADDAYKVERIAFDNGTVWDTAAIIARFGVASEVSDQLEGGSGNDTIDGLGGDDLLSGKGGDDTLIGGAGYDTLDGGAGADQLFGGADGDHLTGGSGDDWLDGGADYDSVNGGAGSDRYAFGRGSEQEYVIDSGTGAGDLDEVEFNADVQTTDLRITRNAFNLLVNIDGAPDQLILGNWFVGSGPFIERFSFADGTVWDAIALEARLVLATATAGGNTIFGSRGADTIDGLDGSDYLYGFEGNDTLIGNTGADTLHGEAGHDTLSGGAGTDTLFGGAGNDTLDGGVNNDLLYGQAGDDTYVLARGTGFDFAYDNDGAAGAGSRDRVLVGPGVTTSQLRITRNVNSLDLAIVGTADKLTLGSWFLGPACLVEEVHFHDGTVLGVADILAHVLVAGEGNDTLFGTGYDDHIDGLGGDDNLNGDAGNDALLGNAGNDRLAGDAGDDTLEGGLGNDTLIGGGGQDVLRGGTGADALTGDDGDDIYDGGAGDDAYYDIAGDETYVLAPGGDRDTVEDLSGVNRVLFAAGTTPADTVFRVEGDDLIVGLKYTGDALRLVNWVATQTIQHFEYADGLTLDTDTVRRLVLDNPHDTVAVNNLFLTRATGELSVGISDADNAVADQLIVGDGLTAGDVRVFRSHAHLVVEIVGTSNRIVLSRWFDDASHRLDALRFADGTVWDRAAIDAATAVAPGTPGHDILFGGNANDTINGGAGADDLHGGEGDDVLIGGDDSAQGFLGNARPFSQYALTLAVLDRATDVLDGAAGNDLLIGSPGRDILYGGEGDDTLDGMGASDWLLGAEGNDTYLIHSGSGSLDRIYETDPARNFGDQNRVVFAEAVTRDSLTVRLGSAAQFRAVEDPLEGGPYDALDLVIGFGNEGGTPWGGSDYGNEFMVSYGEAVADFEKTALIDYFSDMDRLLVKDGALNRVQRYEFYDGTVLTHEQMMSTYLAKEVSGTADADELAGGLGTDLLYGQDGDDELQGHGSGDELFGGAGDDRLEGGAGVDYLWGGAGNDAVLGGAHGDYGFGGDGEDRLEGGMGADWLQGDAGDDIVEGGDGHDRIDGGDGNDTLAGGDGDDHIQGDTLHTLIQTGTTYFTVAGNDAIEGGAGNDRLYGLDGADVVQGGDGNDFLNGGAGSDRLYGGAGNDSLWGDLTGIDAGRPPGTDYLDGGAGADVMQGGLFDDTYVVDDAGDQVLEADDSSGRSDLVLSSIDFALTDHVENLTLTGHDPLQGTGNALANVIRGNDAANVIEGLAGADTLYGGAGGDTLAGGDGRDVLDGGQGGDHMAGGEGDDTYEVDDIADVVVEGLAAGSDTVRSSVSHVLASNLENLTLTGSLAIDGAGNALDNVIKGNSAGNVMAGGQGSDTYHFGRGSAHDTVIDYSTAPGETDHVAIAADVAPTEVGIVRSGDDLRLVISDADTLTLKSWFVDDASKVEEVRFADGTVWDTDYLRAHAGAPGNAAPVLARPFADISASEDSLLTFVLPQDAFTDPDSSEPLSYSLRLSGGSPLPSWLAFDAGSATLSGTPGNAEVGTLNLEVTATDAGALSASDVFDLTVANTNDRPVLAAEIADQYATEDLAFDFVVPAGTFSDIDTADALGYVASLLDGAVLPSWLVFDASTRRFSGTAMNADVGTIGIRLVATDLSGDTATDTFNVTVANTNDAPVAGPALGAQTALEDTLFTWQVAEGAFADQDAGDALVLSAGLANGSALPAWLTFDAATRTLSGTPGNGDVGALWVRLTATDLAGSSAVQDVEVTVVNVNDPPVLANAAADATVQEDTTFSLVLPANMFTDHDAGDTLSYSVALAGDGALPAWLSYDPATRTLAGTPANEHVGVHLLKVTASDGGGGTASDVFELGVVNINDAPTLTAATADQVALAGAAFVLTLPPTAFMDADADDAITYGAARTNGSPLPAWLEFDPTTLTFSGTPDVGDAGTQSIRVTATDAAGLSASDIFDLTVGAPPTGLVLVGTTGSDTLTGGSGDDSLDGRAGADRLIGNAGHDVFQYHADGAWTAGYVARNVGDPGNPGSGKNVAIAGKARSFEIFDGGDGVDVIVGTAADDVLFLDDRYSASPGGVRAPRLAGVERIDGGAGNDVIDLTSTDYALGNVTLEGGDGSDVLWASAGNDVLLGGAGVDDLWGGSGDDFLDGGTGADTLAGGRGHDVYFIDDAADKVSESANSGIDTVRSSVSLVLAANVEKLELVGTSANRGTGNGLANTLTGNGADNILDGAAGADTLVGLDGDDTYVIDNAGDLVLEEADRGFDTMQTSVSRTIALNVEKLVLAGSSGLAGTGDERSNYIVGNAGNNTLRGAGADDLLAAGLGNDKLYGDDGIDVLEGGGGNDALNDSGGNNLFNGGAGNDTMTGGSGNELYIGGAGNDTINTGSGADIIAFNRGDGQDTVSASAGAHHALSLGGGIRATELSLAKTGNHLVVNLGGANDQITLRNWYAASDGRSVSTLQMVVEASVDFDVGSLNPLHSQKLATFDFLGIVDRFNEAGAPTGWAMMNAMLDEHLAGSDTTALGGDLAYRYGRDGTLSGLALNPAQGVLASPQFGGMQTLQPLSSLQEGLVKLG